MPGSSKLSVSNNPLKNTGYTFFSPFTLTLLTAMVNKVLRSFTSVKIKIKKPSIKILRYD